MFVFSSPRNLVNSGRKLHAGGLLAAHSIDEIVREWGCTIRGGTTREVTLYRAGLSGFTCSSGLGGELD